MSDTPRFSGISGYLDLSRVPAKVDASGSLRDHIEPTDQVPDTDSSLHELLRDARGGDSSPAYRRTVITGQVEQAVT